MSKRAASLKAKGAKATSTKKPTALKKGHSSTHQQHGDANEGRQNFYRSNNTVRRLKMYTSKPDMDKMRQTPQRPTVMIEPGRKWFNNTRVVSQAKLEQFREALEEKSKDPSSILLKRTKLPVSLFDHRNEQTRKRAANLLTVEPYDETFSSRKRRKRPRLGEASLEQLAAKANDKREEYEAEGGKVEKDKDILDADADKEMKGPVEAVMLKGTSKRIWNELYKVVDSSDVIVQVLDARDPMGTRCKQLERHIKHDKPFKHLVLLLNKADLIPTQMTEQWVKVLGKEFPTIAFKSSLKHPFGKKSLIGLLRQFADLMKNRKHVSVGFVGYPNVGKSSVINTLRAKKVCASAPVPGETKVWQYVALTNKVYLIDCPGIVAASSQKDGTNDVGKVLKGVVRAEKLDEPEDYIYAIIDRVGKKKLDAHYKIESDWKEPEGFLEQMAFRQGRLKKGGEADLATAARKVIFDFQRGGLPWFVPPPRLNELPPPPKKQRAGETEVFSESSDGEKPPQEVTSA